MSVIRIENLSKSYIIRHQGQRYVALRDVITESVKGIFISKKKVAEKTIKSKEQFWALRDVNFDVQAGDRLGIIGRNGAGKSTLLKVISRITEPTAGKITLKGRIACLLEVGTGFHPELTGRENIFLNGAILGMHRWEIKKKFDEIVNFSGVEQFLDTPVKRYSSGMYVRLAFSVAAHLEPEILIIDEVLAVGDAEFQKRCLGKMEEVGKQGRTVLFVSHNLTAVEQLCNRCILMDGGQLSYNSPNIKEVINKYILSNSKDKKTNEWFNEDHLFENEWFRIDRVALSDAGGNALLMPVRNDSDFFVQVEGEVLQENEKLAFSYFIFDDENRLLYQSATHDIPPGNEQIRFRKGRRIIQTQIPQRFLNEGEYRIEFIMFIHGERFIIHSANFPPTLYLQIEGGLSDSLKFMNRRTGILAPLFTWSTLQ